MNQFDSLLIKLHSLTVFHNLLASDVFRHLLVLLDTADTPAHIKAARYAAFAAAVYKDGGNLTDCVLNLTLESDNLYVRKRAHNLPVHKNLEDCVREELKTLEQCSCLMPDHLRAHIGLDGFLPAWQTHDADFAQAYFERMGCIETTGFGIYAHHHMFTLRDNCVIPVQNTDPISLGDLKGYARQKKTVEDNTLALLDGKPAANALLYGDAGTGKSSTVKALVNAHHTKGLRLIEIPKQQLGNIPTLAESLADHPLKFILFIDDLSFTQSGDDFNDLKAVLEGSVFSKAPNTVIYATSNRRHIVKELFSDREGDDIHRNETIQELCSLSARFGLCVGYFKPDKQAYLDIVRALMLQYGLEMDDGQLELEAERFASAGRSPRIARQFVDHLRRNK